MKDDRLNIPVEPAYTSALGLAVYAFAALEWNAIRCCEKLKAGSIDALMDRTAGRVADTLLSLARSIPASQQHGDMEQAASDFRAFVGTRNNLLHSKPGLDQDGRQRLFRDGDQWTIREMNAVADAFEECSQRLAKLIDEV